MLALEGKTVFHKLWYFLRTYILTLKKFDLFLQGTLLVTLLLRTNALLLLRRDAGTGQIPALLEDWVIIGVAVIEFIIGSVLGWVGRSKRNFALSGCLAVTAIFGLLVLAVPYSHPATTASVELCGGEEISAYTDDDMVNAILTTDSNAHYRMTILVITVLMCSLSIVSIWAHGLTYLDDHEPQNGPYFYGILISIRLSLGLSGQNWLQPSALRDDWWEAQLALSMLVLMFAILFTLFPTKMPQWKQIDVKDDTGFFPSFSRVMRNRVFVLQAMALSLLNASLFGFVTYDKAYVQARFHIESVWVDPRTSRLASDFFRSLVVIFFVMIFRVRFSDRRSDGVKANTAARVGGVVAIFVAIVFSVLAVLFCDTRNIAGIDGGTWQPPQCSWECGCNSGKYGFTPVCVIGPGITHFSPCNAGCHEYEDLNGLILFSNCSCGIDRVVRGSCTLPSCQNAFSAYQIFFTITVAVSAASMLMQGMVMLRTVERWDKPIALGISFSIIALVAYIPGHILYMVISYFTCAYAGENGVGCVFHRTNLWWMPMVSSILALCSASISLMASKVRQNSDGALNVLETYESSISLDSR